VTRRARFVRELDSFLDPPDSPALQKAYADAMSEVADARALVVDLRDNYGGDPRTVAFMLSYLFDPTPVHVNDIVFIPSARAINPITHTNWEGTGVQPDVAVDPADALKVALSLAADAGARRPGTARGRTHKRLA
jgi:C-terminal processing protease CtpA/Prc